MNKMKRKPNFHKQMKVKATINTANAEMTNLQQQNLQLKEQNSQLAKELDEHKAIIRNLTKERDQALQDLIGETAFTRKIMECVNEIQVSAQTNLSNLVSSSNCVTDILKVTHTLGTFNKKDRRSIHASLAANASTTNCDTLKHTPLTNSKIGNEIATKKGPRFTSLNPLGFILNLDPDEADDELPLPKGFRLSEYQKEDEGGEQEFEENNRLDTIAEERQSTDVSNFEPPRYLPNDVSKPTNSSHDFFTHPKSLELLSEHAIPRSPKLKRDTSIQRRSNSLSEEDQIELTDDNEIIPIKLPLLSSTVIGSSPVQIADYRRTRSFERRSSTRNKTEVTEPSKFHQSLDASKALSDSLRLDSSNPTISKFEALKSYNLISVNNTSLTDAGPSATRDKSKFVKKTKGVKRPYARRRTELEKIITSFSSPIILDAISLRPYGRSRELLPKTVQQRRKRKFKEMWSDAFTPKLLRPKTGSLKEPNLRK